MKNIKFGIYRNDEELLDETLLNIIEKNYGLKIDILSFYRAWNYCKIEEDIDWINNLLTKTKREILLTFEPWNIHLEEKVNQKDFKLKNILAGKYDSYIKKFFSYLIPLEKRLYLRTMHEMNGNWYPWCGTVNENSPELYKETYVYIHNLASIISFKPKWIFCPYVESVPNLPENNFANYYPGDYYVDFLGLDGYNWGTERDWSNWKSFEEIFGGAIKQLTDLSDKPIIISEVATTNRGGNKAKWIEDMFKSVKEFPNIFALIWFDFKKECDWRFVK